MPVDPKPLEKLLSQFNDKPKIIKFFEIWKDKWDEFFGVAEDVQNAFDLDTAVGDQLDKIGESLHWERLGFSDDIYRRILKAITNVVLNTRGTTPVLFKIVEALFEPDIDLDYEEVYPAAYMLTLIEPEESMLEIYKTLIRYGKPAGVGMHTIVAPENAFQYDNIIPTNPLNTGFGSTNDGTLGGKFSTLII